MMGAFRSLAAVALLAAALPGAAFIRETTTPGSPSSGTCLWWGDRHVPYRVNAMGVTQTACQVPLDAEAAVSIAMAQWGGASRAGQGTACTDFTFDRGAATSQTTVGRDGVNLVVFRKGLCGTGQSPSADNCWDHGPTTIGLTSTHFDAVTGQISDSDMELYAWDGTKGFNLSCAGSGAPPCTTTGQPGCNDIDIVSVVTHESGHMLGLDHSCTTEFGPAYPVQAWCTASPPIMHRQVGDAQRRALQADDVDGVCTIYPKGAATLTCPPVKNESSGGGCASTGAVGVAGLVGLLAALRLRRRR